MEKKSWQDLPPDLTMAPQFTPVPMQRNRHDGWTAERQQMFIMALTVTGQVEAACRMIRISRKSAYALRDRPDATSFARAWDMALSLGRKRLFDCLFDRALNGVTTITLKTGGAVEIGNGLDAKLVAGFLKSPLKGEDRFRNARRCGQKRDPKGDIR